jgi:hypothetical protein
VLCTLHHPRLTILLMLVIPTPLWLFTLFKVGGDMFFFVAGARTGVALGCHLGGALFGFLYFHYQWRVSNLANFFADFKRRASRVNRPKLHVYHEPRDVIRFPAAVDEQLEAKADAVLAKLGEKGMDSLTDEEKRILKEASEVYKKRRS